jgi:sugar phosphate isomerase/epimerase
MQAAQNSSGTSMSGDTHLSDIYEDKKIVMDDDHEIAEIKREIAKVDGKISEINHWSAQSEYEDEEKRREAVDNARDILQSI